jgi:hypothetical protein
MLNLEVVRKTVEQCNTLALAPRAESWHMAKKIAFTEEMWDSVEANWDKAWEAIEDITEKHAQRVRDEALGYWKQQRDEWYNKFRKDLLAFKKDDDRYGIYPLTKIADFAAMQNRWVQQGIDDPEVRYEEIILEKARKNDELTKNSQD